MTLMLVIRLACAPDAGVTKMLATASGRLFTPLVPAAFESVFAPAGSTWR